MAKKSAVPLIYLRKPLNLHQGNIDLIRTQKV
jgi:hypothetical protein